MWRSPRRVRRAGLCDHQNAVGWRSLLSDWLRWLRPPSGPPDPSGERAAVFLPTFDRDRTLVPDIPQLSVILPFYRKLREFRRVLPLNALYLERPGIEVVLVMDEKSEEAELLALLHRYPRIRWKVVVNDQPHEWRPPCKAINVGLRHARGEFVLIASPESAFVGDVPGLALQVVTDFPDGIAMGRVGFGGFDEFDKGRSLAQIFARNVGEQLHLKSFYGSLCAPRAAFDAIRGYDEGFTDWGGDDDNVRVRLEMAGYTLLACPGTRLTRLSFEARSDGENPKFPFDPAADRVKCSPESVVANAGHEWGRSFSRVPFANPVSYAFSRGPSSALRPHGQSVPAGTAIPTGSRRCCRACGRRVHHEQPTAACPTCKPAPGDPAMASVAAAGTRRTRIGCLMQLRNEEFYLEGCLGHLRDHVDAIVALDDGSTDATPRILAGEARVIDRLVNLPDDAHVWRERENKLRLLRRARELDLDWVLCCDADERFERAFLQRLHMIADSFAAADVVCVSVVLRELWDNAEQYRVDGVWGQKSRARFFRVPKRIEFELDQDLHGQWYPDHIRKYGRIVPVGHNLYHLKSIHRADRIKRRDLYKRLDPHNRFQAIGYDYLAEEGPELRLETIPPGRAYDFDSLPAALRSLGGGPVMTRCSVHSC